MLGSLQENIKLLSVPGREPFQPVAIDCPSVLFLYEIKEQISEALPRVFVADRLSRGCRNVSSIII